MHNRLRYSLLIAFIALCFTCNAKITITKTHCNFQHELALITGNSQVGWQMKSDRNSDWQSAYQIIVRERITNDTVYNSWKISSSRSQQIDLPTLKRNRYGYTWRVRVWDSYGEASAWSKPQDIRVVPDALDAKWIGAISKADAKLPEGRFANTEFKKDYFKKAWDNVDSLSSRSIIVKKEFKIKKHIIDAVVYVSGLGHYELEINGVKVGNSEFAPLWSEYSKTVYYNVYDVTQMLSTSQNEIAVLLGNGFFNVQRGDRYSKLQTSFGPPQVCLRLEVSYDDGTTQVLKSGETWKYCLSPITFNSIYGGESYDATLEDKMPWHNVKVVEGPIGKLVPQTAPPVKIMERYNVKEWHHIPSDSLVSAAKAMKRDAVHPSVIVADMGQNLAGFPEISVSGKRGQKIRMYVSERLTNQGVCDQRQTGRQHFYEYTLRGKGIDTWHPHFSYYGFRYIQIEGAVMQGEPNPSGLPVIYALNSCFVYNSAGEMGTFKCSNELFTRTHRLIERAERSNMQAVLSDCPHREKLGWLEQDHLNGPSLLLNYDMKTYIPKIIRDITDTQKANGMVPTTAPQYVSFGNLFDDSPEWSSTLIILPFMYYDQYGDSTLIVENFDSMRKYVDYLGTKAQDNILDFGLGDWYDYGPWTAGFSRNTPVALVATAHYIYDLQLMQRAAMMAGYADEAERYASLCASVTNSFNNRFYRPDSCSYTSGSQCANALPLFLGICGENKDSVLQTLINDIHKHGDRLTTGDVGNRYLIQALARNGQDELVCSMFNHDEAPGYGYQLKFGATTLTEQWDPRHGSSWNHFMMAQIDEWFYTSVAGIRQKENTHGMQHLDIRPQLVGNMTEVAASTETIYGEVRVHALKHPTGKVTINVTIPVGCDADVTSNGLTSHIESGEWKLEF
ncbi:MAG: family 78 glycoside hydrolase catalytic domain [Prevotellaceae bacterium]|nr:family 78 glycoside hydrolase catalytic domain [Prevotellaceae bacterium]